MSDLKNERIQRFESVASTAVLDVEGRRILVELATTTGSRARGLSGRDTLDADRGMYFMFDTTSVQYFWMNRMKFSIDMVFIQDDTVMSISSDVPFPQGMSLPEVINSGVPVNRVLEINAGKAEEWGIKEGMKVQLIEERK